MNLQLNYHHLRYFLAVAEHGGISHASRLLHVSAPTLSAQISALEAFFGKKLFSREKQRLQLTETGRIVVRYARRIFGSGDELCEVVARGATAEWERILVGVADGVPKLLASRILQRALENASVRIRVREGLPSELVPALVSHQIDLVISNEGAPAALRSALYSERLATFGVVLMASPALAAKVHRVADLDRFPLLVPGPEAGLRRHLETWWRDNGILPDVIAEFDDAAAMYELAAAGVGAAPVFTPLAEEVGARYGLKRLPVKTNLRDELWLLTAEREFQSPGAALLAEEARAVCSKPERRRGQDSVGNRPVRG